MGRSSSLAPAFSRYTNDPGKGNRITRIQQDSVGFARSLSDAVEDAYQWQQQRQARQAGDCIVKIGENMNEQTNERRGGGSFCFDSQKLLQLRYSISWLLLLLLLRPAQVGRRQRQLPALLTAVLS